MVRVSSLRASDADREATAERLRHATAEGRLTPDELADRLGVLYTSKTYGELDALLFDLPVSRVPAPAPTRRPAVRPWLPIAAALALFTVMMGALTDGAHHVVVAAGHRGQFATFAAAHHFADPAASAVRTILALAAVGAVVLWALMHRLDA